MMDRTFRHLIRHWRLNLATLGLLALAAALLASLSTYVTAVSARALHRGLDEAGPAGRSLLITGTPETFGDALYAELTGRLGPLVKDRLVIRYAGLPADPQPPGEAADGRPAVTRVDVYSFDRLPETVRLVEGKLPRQARLGEAVGYWPPAVEAVIGRQAAEQSGYGPGDRVRASGGYHRLDIVGIVEPLDPDDDLWGGDLSGFVAGPDPEGAADGVALPLIVAAESMQSYLGRPVFPHQVSWRISLDRGHLRPANLRALYTDLIAFQAQSAARGAATHGPLLENLKGWVERLSRLRVALWLLVGQSLILVLYGLAMFASSFVDRSGAEIELLSARGTNAWQITRAFALELLIPALPAAFLVGPGLAQGVVSLRSSSTGIPLPGGLSGEAVLLSVAAAGVGWLVLVLSILMAARRCSRGPQSRRASPPQRSAAHSRYVDLYLLVFSAVLVWQLNRSGSFLSRAVARSGLGNTPLADPLFLVGPFLLLIAAAMVFVRILPGLLLLGARPFQSGRGFVFPLGLLRAARNPVRTGRGVLWVILAAGVGLSDCIVSGSLAHAAQALQSAPLLQDASGAFQLNAWMLVLFSATTFFLVSHLAMQGRRDSPGGPSERHILWALGLPPGRWPMLWIVEGVLELVVGLLAGGAAAAGLSYTMMPHLSQALIEPLAGVAIVRPGIDWAAIARFTAMLLAFYGPALALLGLVLGRERRPHALWGGNE